VKPVIVDGIDRERSGKIRLIRSIEAKNATIAGKKHPPR
jgi:hypothetical protein